MEKYSASCLCGDVRVSAEGLPARVGICHCTDCRKHHGALFYAAAVFDRAAVTISGTTGAFRGRHFCPVCGSSVFAETGDEIEIHLGALDGEAELVPDYELWTIRRAPWLPAFPGCRTHPQGRES